MKEVFKSRLLKLADTIEDHPHVDEDGQKLLLNMDTWGHQSPCGTTACMAGFAVMQESRARTWTRKAEALIGLVMSRPLWAEPVAVQAAQYLGLTATQATDLFHPCFSFNGDTAKISERRAAGVLRHFVKTGEVNWNIKRLPKRGEVS